MINDSILTIFQSEFQRSIDDTIINRLSETLFCKNLFHEDFWKKLLLSENSFITTLINEKGIESMSHVNLSQVFVGLYHKNDNYFNVIEKIIKSLLKNKEPSIYYCGLWCVSKLINLYNFRLSTLFQILDLYVCNNNVIFNSLLQDILINIYFEYFRDSMYEEFRQKFISILFERIDESSLFLIKILEKNLCEYDYNLFEIEKYLKKIQVSEYISKPELLYCYAMCSNHDNNVVKTIEESNEKQANFIAKKILYLSNGKIMKIISRNSIGASIWKICIDRILKSDENFMKLFMSVKSMDINLIPNNIFIKLITEGKHNFFKDLKLGKFEIYYVCSFLERNNFQNIMENKTQGLIRCLFNSFYNNREIFDILISNSKNDSIKKTFNKIIALYKSEIHNRKSFDDIDFYSNLISDCLKSDSIDNENKLKLLSTEAESLLVFQNYLLRNYFNSDNLEILSNKPLQLSKEILLLDNGNFIFHFSIGSLDDIIYLTNSIINADDFSDNVFCGNLFYSLLVLFSDGTKGESVTNVVVNFIDVLGKRNIILNIKDLLGILPRYVKMANSNENGNRIFQCLKANLVLFQFHKCNLSIEQVIDSSGDDVKHLLRQLTFVRDYCNVCHENIQELIEDLALSCKPLDCYGD